MRCISGRTRSREPDEPGKIIIIKERSFSRGFEIGGKYVRIYCHYAVKDNTSERLTFKIKGNFQKYLQDGLLKEAGGAETNQDKLLPDTEIEYINGS